MMSGSPAESGGPCCFAELEGVRFRFSARLKTSKLEVAKTSTTITNLSQCSTLCAATMNETAFLQPPNQKRTLTAEFRGAGEYVRGDIGYDGYES